MEDNPYVAPVDSPTSLGEHTDELLDRLRRIALIQRLIMVVLVLHMLLIPIGTVACLLVTPQGSLVVASCVALGFAVLELVGVFFLAYEVYGSTGTILCTLLMFVPCVSLITLLVVSQNATATLQQHGVKVGLFGVSPSSIRLGEQ